MLRGLKHKAPYIISLRISVGLLQAGSQSLAASIGDGQAANLASSLPLGLFRAAAQRLHRVTDTSGAEETAVATRMCYTPCIGE